MTTLTEQAADAAIVAAATTLMLPTVRTQAAQIADAAARDQLTHRGYLAELLATEVDDRAERRRIRRIRQARFPRLKHLADFDTSISVIDPATIATLTQGGFIDAGTPVVFLGDSGTGKTHLLIGTGIAACHTGRTVRYVTAAALVNELAHLGTMLSDQTLPHTACRVTLLPRHLKIVYQPAPDDVFPRTQHRTVTSRCPTWRRHRIPNSLTHRPPMHTMGISQPADRRALTALTTNLLK